MRVVGNGLHVQWSDPSESIPCPDRICRRGAQSLRALVAHGAALAEETPPVAATDALIAQSRAIDAGARGADRNCVPAIDARLKDTVKQQGELSTPGLARTCGRRLHRAETGGYGLILNEEVATRERPESRTSPNSRTLRTSHPHGCGNVGTVRQADVSHRVSTSFRLVAGRGIGSVSHTS